jgi:uncharacterized membrane protein YedE/YeeE
LPASAASPKGCCPFAGAIGRVAFVAGLLAGGAAFYVAKPNVFQITTDRSLPVLVLAGLCVGLGTVMSNGCTSGHGVCGVSRLSRRSIAATLTFIAAGMVTVFAYNFIVS